MSHPSGAAESQGASELPRIAVVCGNVRNPAETIRVFSTLIDWRREGVIHEIVWSTWHGEYSKLPELQRLLRQSGVVLFESAEPSPRYYIQQKRQIRLALETLPENSWVFKCRTDKVLPGPEHRHALLNYPQSPHAIAGNRWILPGLFRFKTMTQAIDLTAPFYNSDTLFLGTCRDLKQFAQFDLSHEGVLLGRGIPHEASLWGHPFFLSSHHIGRYLMHFDPYQTTYLPYEQGEQIFNFRLGSSFFLRFLASSLIASRNFLSFGWDANRLGVLPEAIEKGAAIEEFFRKPIMAGLDLWCAENAFRFVAPVDWLPILGERGLIRGSEGSERFQSIYSEMSERGAHRKLDYSMLQPDPEIEEHARGLKERFGIESTGPRLRRL